MGGPRSFVGILSYPNVDGPFQRALRLEQVGSAEKRIGWDVSLYANFHAYV